MTDATKAVVRAARYEPFGAVSAITGAAALNARFPGQWFQIEDGLAYNWHRTYDATLGRYTQADPLGFVDGPSVYGYAEQSPLVLSDRDGRIVLPNDPSGLPPGWVRNPQHLGSQQWRGPSGGCLEFDPGTPGAPGFGGDDHWHDCTGRRKDKKRRDRHYFPGEDCPQPEDAPQPVPDPQPESPRVGTSPNSNPWWWVALMVVGGMIGGALNPGSI